jgi:hypothetical protein
VSATVRLRVIPDEGATAIFEHTVTIGPGRLLSGRELVTMAPSSEYRLDVLQGDKRIGSTKIAIRCSDQSTRCQLFFLDEDPSFEGASDLGKTKALLYRCTQTRVRAADAPSHWAEYDDSRVVAVGTPDFTRLGSDQCAALIEYANRGGTIVFFAPAGTLAAAQTPLAEILPVVPLRVRRVEELPELDAWGQDAYVRDAREPFASPDGIPFLESAPLGGGFTTLAHGELPIIRWRSVGLGRVGVVAVDPCGALARNSGCAVAVWNHILSWAQSPYSFSYRENNVEVPALMAQLTGHRIPGVGPIGRLLFGYALLVGVILVVGYWKRRHVAAWLATAGIGVLATSLVFVSAYRANTSRSASSATILSFRGATHAPTSTQSVISLQTRADARPTFRATDPDTLIRSLPPITRGKQKQTGEAPLLVRREDELSTAPAMAIRALKPRTFATDSVLPSLNADPIPMVVEGGGLVLPPAQLPAFLSQRETGLEALAVLPGGIRSVRLGEGEVLGFAPGGSLLRLNPFLTDLASLLDSGRFPTPSLAFIAPATAKADGLPLDLGDFATQGYTITFVPLHMTMDNGDSELSPDLVRVAPHDNASRAYLSNPDLSVIRHPEQFLTFDLILPPWLADFEATSIELDLEGSNPGGNIRSDVRLHAPVRQQQDETTNRQRAAGPIWNSGVEAAEREGDTFRYPALPRRLFSANTRRCLIVVRLSQNTFVRDPTIAQRTNSWRFHRLRARISGTFPEQGEF